MPEQTRSHEFAQGPHTLVMDLVLAFMEMNILVRNLDLDFMEMNILINRFSTNRKIHISDLRQL